MIRKYFINKIQLTPKKKIVLILVGFSLIWFWFALPNPLFEDPTSTVLVDENQHLLGAKIADDGQWRFPENKEVPKKFRKSIVFFEDEYFKYHPGVNPVSIVKALGKNISKGRVVSGGSTLSMQVIRLSRKGKPRTIWQKIIESLLALRLELTYSKDEILSLYTSHAPFGGNVVGLDAASWRYYGRSANSLSWAEAATMAVLPNAPSLIYPGKNHQKLLKKRNRLLDKLYRNGMLDSISCELAKLEELPLKPHSLPALSRHLLDKSEKDGLKGMKIESTINYEIQDRVNQIVKRHHLSLSQNEIHNAAVLILDVETGKVLAYHGNVLTSENKHNNYVDVIHAKRSTGSILKPFLFAAMLNEGMILPNTLVTDIPTQISGYAPMNFDRKFSGAVAASEALARSLNIPAVRMLRSYGIEKFLDKMQKLGMTTLSYNADHYGLSLILGGGEASLWELTGIYAGMARTLNHYNDYESRYDKSDFHEPFYQLKDASKFKKGKLLFNSSKLEAGAIWNTLNALTGVNRPLEESGWEQFSSSNHIAWKTGTSFGFRDAWAIGVTSKYAVGVWVGNADGEGRPGLTGVSKAAPIMFDVFRYLPKSKWFKTPFDDLKKIAVCKQSGYRVTSICEDVDSVNVPVNGLRSVACPYHQIVHLDPNGLFRVNSECMSSAEMIHKPWFVLPTIQEWYYKSRNANYKVLPPMLPECEQEQMKNIDIIYPQFKRKIFIPRELNGKMGETVFEVVHRKSKSKLYWHIDDQFKGETFDIHQKGFRLPPGKHTLILIDEFGEKLSRQFEVIGKG